ncbi:DnaJ C-terminal domain-containing protein [Pontimonas sp.]|nr:DnaJ C-terminal domain-containing protein [Pontimonas sp.]
MASQDWLEKNFYKILGVSKGASDAEIKKSYRSLSRKYHPDVNRDDPQAEARFKEVSEAYSVLSDKNERAEYDQIRTMQSGGPRFSAGGSQGGFEDVFGGMFGGGMPRSAPSGDYGDLFSGLFGGGGGGFNGYREPTKGRDVVSRVTIDLKTAIAGTDVTLEGPGGKKITARVPAGVKDGQKVRLRGKGHPSPDGGKAGDVIITVGVPKHQIYSRDGDHLRIEVPITFGEATLGATVEVPTIDGEIVKVKIPAGTPSGKVLRVKGKGVRAGAALGDLLVELQVAVPSHLSGAAKGHLEKLMAALPNENPREDLVKRAKG